MMDAPCGFKWLSPRKKKKVLYGRARVILCPTPGTETEREPVAARGRGGAISADGLG